MFKFATFLDYKNNSCRLQEKKFDELPNEVN